MIIMTKFKVHCCLYFELLIISYQNWILAFFYYWNCVDKSNKIKALFIEIMLLILVNIIFYSVTDLENIHFDILISEWSVSS